MLEKDNIEAVADILIDGGIICYPTDTVWGIGCDATNVQAINRINDLKGRTNKKGFVLLVDSIAMLKNYVSELHPRIETLLEYHERPLTIIYPKAKNLPAEVCGEDGSVAIRLAKCSFCQAIIKNIDAPLVSTSANLSGVPYPKTFGEISSEIIEKVDYIAKERRWDKTNGQPSTIAFVNNNGLLEFIRE
ncbi:MAG TPA: threonylcarbamoyl-AMP synthase [Saprospiraceae bacterium]|nr:threonylcarbamoyl-AMP synthase [Saprospiraceae bacterium]